jgi:hypothetical protein
VAPAAAQSSPAAPSRAGCRGVRAAFDASGGTYGSPRITAELRAVGWQVSKNTVAAVMAAQQLVARPKRRRGSLTRADKTARRAPDRVGRDFSAAEPNLKGTVALGDRW